MAFLDLIYIASGVALTLAGLAMVGFSTRAYYRTSRKDMIFLSLGFVFIVSSSIGTTIGAFLTNFQVPELTFTVDYLLKTIGFALIIYSVIRKNS
ncbi:MAG: putative membrane protein [Candidatus Methanohalarchaeum thermophilum]|uniref:Membrane protein n=1 Tax=Methanohalarchaeum thermophilum TaxID=1903181 RepID=A0A1Q6DUD3_METT1|nr:MAG: putative membrane protein [Candidatus Methanohalarchaeum thermophilum]